MNKKVDARGLSCPQPVLETKKVLEEIREGVFTVIVDNALARENVTRFAEANGCSVEIEEKPGEFHLMVKKGDITGEKGEKGIMAGEVMLIGTDVLGKGDRKLGETLMEAFIYTLVDCDPKPRKIILLNDGVKLATEGSPVLEALEVLHDKGVEISSCGTCLNFYALKDKLKVGKVTNMFEIINAMKSAAKVITL